MTLPVLRGCGCWGLTRGVWHHQDRRRRGPREFTGIVDHSRGGSSHGPLVGPGPGKVWHRVQELAGRARRRLPCRGANRDAVSPSRDSKNAIAWPAPRTPPASSMPSISSNSPVTLQVRCVAASSKTRPVTADAQAIPSTKSGFSCAPHTRKLTPRQQERLREAFRADEAHISVEVAYLHRASARGLPPRHTRPRPTPGRTPH